MRKIIERSILFLLIFTMVLGYFEPLNVFANKQYPVSNFTITDFTAKDDISYTLNFRWSRPPASNNPDLSAIQPGGSDLHRAEDYDIFYKNATKGEEYGTQPKYTLKSQDETVNKNYSLYLDQGSLYSFKVVPFHFHEYKKGTLTIQEKAPIDTTGAAETESLYLTNIVVSAKGSGSNLKVTWDNPTYNGKDVFSGYRIYYSPGGSQLTTIPEYPHIDVSTSDLNLIRTKDGKLEYTFQDSELLIGKLYAVKVEPLYNGALLRDKTKIDINGKPYNISYASKDVEYRTSEAYVRPSLNVQQEGQDFIRLYWDSFKNSIQNIRKIEIFESSTEDFKVNKSIGVLSGQTTSRDINFWLTVKPPYKMYYKIVISYEEDGKVITMESEIAVYDPAFKDFEPYKPNIFQITDNASTPLSLEVIWEAFLREPYNSDEKANLVKDYNKYLDTNIIYDVWITDEVTNFDSLPFLQFPVASIKASDLSTKDFINAEKNIKQLAYTEKFNSYYKKNTTTGNFEKMQLEDNKIYYVKIVATRDPSLDKSKAAFGSHYIAPVSDIGTSPIMISKPPLKIKVNEDGTEEITDTSITIQWTTKWFEAYDNSTKTWYSKIGIDTNGEIIFGDQVDKITDKSKIIYLNDGRFQNITEIQSKEKIKAELIQKGALNADLLALRLMDLKNANYEIHTVPFDYVESKGGYDEYLKELSLQVNDANWESITPTIVADTPEYKVTKESIESKKQLSQNTSYIIFFRPYIISKDGKKNSYFPSFVVGTTLSKRGPIDIVPTVPLLEAVSETDTSTTVRWQYSEALEYILAMSEKLSDYSEKGAITDWETIKNNGVTKIIDGKKYIYYTYEKLFPDSNYYIWIKSSIKVADSVVSSNWSNPIIMKTKDILAPTPPDGLGRASKDNVDIYNKEKKTTYKPIGPDYIIVEWLKNSNELGSEAKKPVESKATDNAQILESVDFKEIYLAKFNNLVSNRPYYFRAKTILTITKDEAGGAIKNYSYIIQMSQTEKFIDVVEIIVPPLVEITDEANSKVKESEWSTTIKLNTNTSSNEFDSDINPDLFPLPTEDFEILYNRAKEELFYRYRTNQKDASGNNDNAVDQRFISSLISSKVFNYKIDLTKYGNYQIKSRVVELPYSIFKAFEDRKIGLTLIADNLSVSIPSGALNTSQLKSLNGFGLDSKIKITLTKYPKSLPPLRLENGSFSESFASAPQELTVSVTTKDKTIYIKNFEKEITVTMKLNNIYSVLANNVSMCINDGNTEGYERVKFNYDNLSGTMQTNTVKAATYSIISKTMPTITNENNINISFNMMKKIDIKGLNNYNSNDIITATQFNNLALAIAKNKYSVEINRPLEEADIKSLERSKIFLSDGEITNEASINAIVRLYEIKSGASIKNYSLENETDISYINSVASKYKTSFLKAEKIGLLPDMSINPKDKLTLINMFYMLDIVMEDSKN